MRHRLVLLSLLFLVGSFLVSSAPVACADDAATLDDALTGFEKSLTAIKPRLYASLSQQERDLANQVEFDLDRTDPGVAPQAEIKGGRRVVRFPLGFVSALDVFSRSLATAYCCDSRVQSGLDAWFGVFAARVKLMESGKSARAVPDDQNIDKTPSLCDIVLKDRNHCLAFQTDKFNPLYNYFWQTSRSLADAILLMVSARELSEHLLGHMQGDANQNLDSYDKIVSTDRKSAAIYFAALLNPYFASPAFAFSVIVQGEGVDADDRIGHPSTLCRSLAVNAVIFQGIVTDMKSAEAMHIPEATEKGRDFQGYLDKIRNARHERCSNN